MEMRVEINQRQDGYPQIRNRPQQNASAGGKEKKLLRFSQMRSDCALRFGQLYLPSNTRSCCRK